MLKDVQARLGSDEGSDEFYGSVFIEIVPSETEDERMTARSDRRQVRIQISIDTRMLIGRE